MPLPVAPAQAGVHHVYPSKPQDEIGSSLRWSDVAVCSEVERHSAASKNCVQCTSSAEHFCIVSDARQMAFVR